ncbi:MAG: hypothetical protein P8L18_05535 [Verrucomicrobiota bacterium]|nr:hypothetical protein [Verrucomicrobiota bacterium]
MIKKVIIALLTITFMAGISAQETGGHPLNGGWKWTRKMEDHSIKHGFRFYWTDDEIGVHRTVHLEVDPDTRMPSYGWTEYQTFNKNGIGTGLLMDSMGLIGQSTEVFEGTKSFSTFTGSSTTGLISGTVLQERSGDGTRFTEHIKNLVNGEGAWTESVPVLSAEKIDYNPFEQGDVIRRTEDMNPILDDRFQSLLSRWESRNAEGKITLKIGFRKGGFGKSITEKWTFLDDDGEVRASGVNITRKDPVNGQLVLYSVNKDGFSRTGGWDFMQGATSGQRQGNARLVRRFLTEDTIHATWQEKKNGTYEDSGNSYILHRVKKESTDEETETTALKSRSYQDRAAEAQRFNGFVKQDFKIVSPENEAPYLAAEAMWKTLHEQRMQKGALHYWHVAKINNAKPGEPNYVTTQVYGSMEDLQNGAAWDTLDYSHVGGREALGQMTWPYVTSAGSDTYQAVDQYWSSTKDGSEVSQLNYGYMTPIEGKEQAYVHAERHVAKPFWSLVESMDPSFHGWGMHRLVSTTRKDKTHGYITIHFKNKDLLPSQAAWDKHVNSGIQMLNAEHVSWDTLRHMEDGMQTEVVLRVSMDHHPVQNEWAKLQGNWRHTHEDGSYRIKRISPHTEQLEVYDAEGRLTMQAVVPMKIEIKGGLNHFYALHPQGTYHSIYKIVDGKWYEQMRGIWRDGGGRPDAFLVYEKF